jgi:hypothetical protein
MMRVLVEGVRRGRLDSYVRTEPYIEALVEVCDEKEGENQPR